MSAAPARRRGTYQRSRERREQITLAVLEIVDELGHDGVTTALVATRSDTPEATVLYHFPTKEHLLVGALERTDDRPRVQGHAVDTATGGLVERQLTLCSGRG